MLALLIVPFRSAAWAKPSEFVLAAKGGGGDGDAASTFGMLDQIQALQGT